MDAGVFGGVVDLYTKYLSGKESGWLINDGGYIIPLGSTFDFFVGLADGAARVLLIFRIEIAWLHPAGGASGDPYHSSIFVSETRCRKMEKRGHCRSFWHRDRERHSNTVCRTAICGA